MHGLTILVLIVARHTSHIKMPARSVRPTRYSHIHTAHLWWLVGFGGISPAGRRKRVPSVKVVGRKSTVAGHVVEGVIVGQVVVNRGHGGLVVVVHMHLRSGVLAGWRIGIAVVRLHVSALTVPLV